jgi:hypothetical protein
VWVAVFHPTPRQGYAFSVRRKRSKDTITVLMYANMDESEKMPLLVIGKQEK